MKRFNTPPGWPRPPDGWLPPPWWQPDPSWPPAPPGWQFVVEEEPDRAGAPAQPGLWIALAGGALVLLSPVLPWIQEEGGVAAWEIKPGVRILSGLLGAALMGAALGSIRAREPGTRTVIATLACVFAAVACGGYLLLIAVGQSGTPVDSGYGFTVASHWSPGPGLIFSVIGAAVCAVGQGITAVRSRRLVTVRQQHTTPGWR
ncbi:hypothetical protein GA0115240_14975 [Streptomyces sp. DvalAA-14]|uniref:hypothetical protein n=1 Tax=unclassified Streptomyces TaxID=2593676 RepID=UPI00081B8191|nr:MULTISPECIES: hypothetical protein [unclassified Streptomyces]SCE29495.1 hypothetical protein GA0115240_14975 [Streptomyces sp. DvalAA-14]